MTLRKLLLGTAAAALLGISPAMAADEHWQQECKGILQAEDGGLTINVPPEGLCEINSSEIGKVLASCTPGHFCRVYGVVESCKDSGECAEFTKVFRVRPK
jgi:hypothetical protein